MREYFKNTLPSIEAALEEIFPRSVTSTWIRENIGDHPYTFDVELWEKGCSKPFYDLFDRGGKRLRPVLAVLTNQALNGLHPDIYKFSAIPEIIHTATLIHDDMEDESQDRRGAPAIHHIHGVPISINTGGFLLHYPRLIIQNSNLDDHKKVQLYHLVDNELTKLHIGQAMDIYWSQQKDYEIQLGEYRQMSAYKTGALLSVAVKMGAILANASPMTLSKLEKVAIATGIAFQIKDDILNVKPTDEWGKESGEDITEGKLTYLVSATFNSAKKSDRGKLKEILLAGTKDRTEIDRAVRIMEKYKAFTRAEKYAKRLVRKAKTAVMEALPETDFRRIYLEILDYAVARKK